MQKPSRLDWGRGYRRKEQEPSVPGADSLLSDGAFMGRPIGVTVRRGLERFDQVRAAPVALKFASARLARREPAVNPKEDFK